MDGARRGGVTGEGLRIVLATLPVGDAARGTRGGGLPTRVLDARDKGRGVLRSEARAEEPAVPRMDIPTEGNEQCETDANA